MTFTPWVTPDILTLKYIILRTYFACFFFSGRAKYVCEHTSALPFLHTIITHHFLLSKVSRPIHTIPGINAHLLYPSYAPGSILSDTNYYIVLYVFLVVSMATNIV